MKTLFAVTLAVATAAGFSASRPSAIAPATLGTADQTSDAAFRDGLYQAKLAAARGDAPHVAIGRWGSDHDRTSFANGYLQGYRQAAGGTGSHRTSVAPFGA